MKKSSPSTTTIRCRYRLATGGRKVSAWARVRGQRGSIPTLFGKVGQRFTALIRQWFNMLPLAFRARERFWQNENSLQPFPRKQTQGIFRLGLELPFQSLRAADEVSAHLRRQMEQGEATGGSEDVGTDRAEHRQGKPGQHVEQPGESGQEPVSCPSIQQVSDDLAIAAACQPILDAVETGYPTMEGDRAVMGDRNAGSGGFEGMPVFHIESAASGGKPAMPDQDFNREPGPLKSFIVTIYQGAEIADSTNPGNGVAAAVSDAPGVRPSTSSNKGNPAKDVRIGFLTDEAEQTAHGESP